MEESALDKNIRKFKTHLSTYPNKQLAQLLRGYVLPIMEEMRFEYSDAFSYLEDQISGDGSDSEVLDEARDTVIFLATFLDGVLGHLGWLKENEIAEEFPTELRGAFEEAKERIVSLMQSIEEAQASSDDDDGDEEDEQEAAAAEAATAEAATAEAATAEAVVAAEQSADTTTNNAVA